ncbi:MAG: biotin--[acetyl-CoA-carboxylase] ligase [Clostridiales Family XIII bacterium]|jgi:biotin-[acetyl-CoA-carboxylase] ligase BirA-like protein|nr:biotin--[acetyl-CoA-carboxylase] ligase [Clostridiales Family XIII bacterium]
MNPDHKSEKNQSEVGHAGAESSERSADETRSERRGEDTSFARDIRRRLNGIPCRLIMYKTVTSTNDEAKRLLVDALRAPGDGSAAEQPLCGTPCGVTEAADGHPSKDPPHDSPFGTIIIADEQTAGRGRRGRAFASPAADSVYLSFILQPITAANTLLVTIMAAVAVCEAVEKVTAGEPAIKWVNDIYLNGRKICGILAEAISGICSGTIHSASTDQKQNDCGIDGVILGIGVNINVPPHDFPEEIRDTADSVSINPRDRGLFTAELIERVIEGYEGLTRGVSPIPAYRERSFIIDSEIIIVGYDDTETPAVAEDIADDGSLIVRYPDGSKESLNSGEVRVRRIRVSCAASRVRRYAVTEAQIIE